MWELMDRNWIDKDKSACFVQQMCGDAQQESQDLNLFLAGAKGESPSIPL